jgi:hypothetical protein
MKKLIILILSILPTICWSQEKMIQSGQPIPKERIENKNCLDNSSTAIRLLSHEPHVPFAIIDKDTIKSAGQTCCEEWATTQIDWFNLNEYGKVVGKSKVISGDGYDHTQCYELQLKTIDGSDGTGLYASKDIDWELDNEQIWSPNQVEKAKLDNYILDLDKLVIDDKKPNYVDTLTKGKMIFFRIAHQQSEDENNIPLTKCVVFGKRYLMIAYLNSQEEWTLAHIENEYTNDYYKLYTPIALIDINKDGIPEIIFQDSLGHVFWDKILRIQNKETIDSWKIEAISVEGATI